MEIKLHKWLQDIKLIVKIQGETSIHTWFEFMPILLVYVLESKTIVQSSDELKKDENR